MEVTMIVKTVVMTVDIREVVCGGEGKNDRDGRNDDVEGDGDDGDHGSKENDRGGRGGVAAGENGVVGRWGW